MKRIHQKILREVSFHTGCYTAPPEFLSLIITWRCNFKCASCDIWKKTNHQEMAATEWQKIITSLRDSLSPDTFVEINGGEALLQKDLALACITEAKKYFKTVTLNSNGLLINADLLRELKQAGLDVIKISFYSLDKNIHNTLRGHPGAFDHARAAINLINQNQIALEVGVLLAAPNIANVPDLIEYLQKLPNTAIILQALDEKVESAQSKNLSANQLIGDLWPCADAVNKFFDYAENHREKIKNSPANLRALREYYLNPENILKYRCFAGQRNTVIYPSGDVAFCFKTPPIGNIKNQNLKTILQSATGARRKIKNCKKYCRIVGCNFSRGVKEWMCDKLN